MCSVTQSCLTLCDPMDCSPPGSSVHGISQASVLEWVQVSSVQLLSHVRLFATPWMAALQASLSITNSWSLLKIHVHRVGDGVGSYFLLQGIFLTQGSNPYLLCFLHWQADSLPLVQPGKPQKDPNHWV